MQRASGASPFFLPPAAACGCGELALCTHVAMRRRPPLVMWLILIAATHRVAAPVVCDYQAEIREFNFLDKTVVDQDGSLFDVTMDSINIGFGTSGVNTIDSTITLLSLEWTQIHATNISL